MIDRFLYLVSEGIRSLWRTKTTALASISAIGIAASFVVFSAVVGENISGIIQIARAVSYTHLRAHETREDLVLTRVG